MRRPDLVPDCSACAALCCVATSFERSEDFAFDKPAGVPCQYLTRGNRCAIHAELVGRGCRGCAVYDCYGAGQRATRAFGDAPAHVRDPAFLILRSLHEQLWLLTEAAKLCPPGCDALHAELSAQVRRLATLASSSDAAGLVEVGLRGSEARTRALLRRIGEALGGRSHRVASS